MQYKSNFEQICDTCFNLSISQYANDLARCCQNFCKFIHWRLPVIYNSIKIRRRLRTSPCLKLCLRQNVQTLAIETEQWFDKIFDSAKVEISSSQSNIIELLLNTSNSKDRFKGLNISFGYHCILPIIVSGLIAKEGEMLIVENPEASLHPRAQSRLAQFLAKVSNCGVQVFIETHSDHILNALRIAVLDKIITPDDLSILYFQRNSEQPVVQIPVQPNGGIEEWSEGFFDQIDKDFSRLFGI